MHRCRPEHVDSNLKHLFGLEGKVALVTGGSKGIGAMIAKGLAMSGARVYVCSRNPAESAVESESPPSIIPISADLSNTNEIARLAAEIQVRESKLHILVNNSGATWGAPIGEFPENGWDKVMDLNLKAPFFLTQSLLPLLDSAALPEDPARVINVGSIDGIHAGLFEAYSYAASKAGLHHLTRLLAKFLAQRHITVNAIAPGPFESKMLQPILKQVGSALAESVPLRRLGREEDMAGVAVYLSSQAGAYVTGSVLTVDGGLATTS